MGTHCYIAKEVGPHQYRAIFCQLDGYLEEVGAKLAQYYDTEEMVDKLLDLGDIYSLAPKLDPDPNKPHEFLNRQPALQLHSEGIMEKQNRMPLSQQLKNFWKTTLDVNSYMSSIQTMVGSTYSMGSTTACEI